MFLRNKAGYPAEVIKNQRVYYWYYSLNLLFCVVCCFKKNVLSQKKTHTPFLLCTLPKKTHTPFLLFKYFYESYYLLNSLSNQKSSTLTRVWFWRVITPRDTTSKFRSRLPIPKRNLYRTFQTRLPPPPPNPNRPQEERDQVGEFYTELFLAAGGDIQEMTSHESALSHIQQSWANLLHDNAKLKKVCNKKTSKQFFELKLNSSMPKWQNVKMTTSKQVKPAPKPW